MVERILTDEVIANILSRSFEDEETEYRDAKGMIVSTINVHPLLEAQDAKSYAAGREAVVEEILQIIEDSQNLFFDKFIIKYPDYRENKLFVWNDLHLVYNFIRSRFGLGVKDGK